MKLAIVSDTHFGDPMCTLVNHRTLEPGAKFGDFATAAGKRNDFLVMLGDIFDFSITSYEEAYKRAKAFFRLVKEQRIAKNIIYVPGNHDVDMWQTVQQQINVIRQVRLGKPARKFRWSVPGFIDDRSGSRTRGFRLPGVVDSIDPNRKPGREPDSEKLFLNGITKDPEGGGTETNFYVAYPNLYMVTDDESIVLTHGHYLEAFWTISGAWIKKIVRRDLTDTDNLEDLVALNAPLCQLACSGIGQAGKLTTLVQKVQREVKDGDLKRLEKYIERLDNALDKLTKVNLFKPKTWAREWVTDAISNKFKKELIKNLRHREDTRYSEEFMTKEEVQQRFKYFYRVSLSEIDRLNRAFRLSIVQPQKVIFGHTHRPIEWLSPDAPDTTINRKKVRLYNTGGWLWRKGKKGKREFCGAEVFLYDTAKGFSSKRIE